VSETPPVILAQHLAESRRQGACFTDAWPAAVAAALGGKRSSWEIHEYRIVFAETIDEFCAAFERRPGSQPGLALHRLEEPDAVPVPERDALNMTPSSAG